MSTIDLSRQATDARKHYAGVRMQQGRVLTDDDFNDAATIDAEELRRTRLHAIGAYGTPDAGFLPKDFAVVGGKLDFKLSNGSLYLGGLRLEMDSEDHYLLQEDWLNFNPAVDAQTPPASGTRRMDLVWIESWQQPVTAVEDTELFEVALGGPDTSTRWRSMRRVHVAAGVQDTECADAWTAVSAGFAALGSMNSEMELATTARLRVSFTAPPVTGDLCSPPQAGGYLGAENQAIRVQVVDATHYTWGYDNASPLYRAQLSSKGGQLVKLTLLNQPRDAVHWPLKDQVVELLPWSAALANGERIAEAAGHLCKVAVSYNPNDHTLEIDTAVPATFGTQWQSRADKADFFDGSSEQNFFYLRLWNRGDDLASPASIPIANGKLGNTGLQVAFNGGPLRPGDYWVIAARPAAPEVLVPWSLESASGAAPNGIRRYRAPLALIEWTTEGGVTTGKVIHDCRLPFLPLTRIRGCCSATVGDGTHSFGMFNSVQAAIDSLPPSGGTVCILPGRYQEAVSIEARRNVTLHGCGPRSRIVAPATEGDKSTALVISGSLDVVVESLAFEGGTQAVIEVDQSSAVRIACCLIQFRDVREVFSTTAALFVEGHAVEIEHNIIEALPDDLNRVFHELAESLRGKRAHAARGGIQLAGGCEQVRIASNVIVGGSGNGITLGSILRFDENHPNGIVIADIDVEDPCAPCNPIDNGPPPEEANGTVRYESAGDLYEIEIEDNIIARHGANGIAVVRFFDLTNALTQPKGMILVTVHRLRITRNRIVACLRRAVAKPSSKFMLLLGYGGISLAFTTELEIDANLITSNGRDWLSPVCGIFVLATDGLRIEHNQIRCNGERNEEPVDSAQAGIRAGIHIWLALSLQARQAGQDSDKFIAGDAATVDQPPSRGGVGQLRLHGNLVEQPLGRALFMLGAGPMHITDNRLVSEGTGTPATDPIASTVLVADLGFSKEWTRGLLMTFLYLIYAKLFKTGAGNDQLVKSICSMSKLSRFMPGIWPRLPTGKLMFNDNQVSFLMADAPVGLELSSVLLLSLDDLSANDNQLEWHAQQRLLLADLLAAGFTLRSNGNRLSETWGRAVRSILSAAPMNTASDNQSTHCISALGLRRAVHHNLTLAEAFCPDFCGHPETLFGHLVLGAQVAMRRQ